MIWFKKHEFMIMLLTLLWCSVSVYTCSNSSTTQVPIKVTVYNDNSSPYAMSDIVMDGSMNKYFVYAYPGTGQAVHIARINSDASIGWTKKYDGFKLKNWFKSTQISSSGDVLMVIGEGASNP